MEDYFVSDGMLMKTMKKRKEVEELDQVNEYFSDFSLSPPARKIRRLDAHLPPIMEEEEADFAAAPNQVKSDAPIIEELPSGNNEKAVMLFKPVNSPLFFSFRSELIPGFKAAGDDEAVQNSENQCKAVVPWVYSKLGPRPSMEVSQSEAPEEMGTATMEIEEGSREGQGMANGCSGGMWTSNEGFPQWQQQHCMIPQPPQNTTTPIAWFR
ncbi:hypothetical protein EV1_022384 [Malus domestica]